MIKGMAVSIPPDAVDEILRRTRKILEKGWLMDGDEQIQLRQNFMQAVDREHCVTMNSGTAGLEILFSWLAGPAGLGVENVVLQANAFPSVVFAAERAGIEHIKFMDLAVGTMSFNLAELKARHETFPIHCLVVQHNGGHVGHDFPAIAQWCREEKVILIEDASHAAGTILFNTWVGKEGYASVFSLAATKPLQTGQGGVVLTDDPDFALYAFRMKNYGRTEMFHKGVYVEHGFNSHMTEMQAAIGNVMFGFQEEMIRERYLLKETMLKGCDHVVSLAGMGRSNWYKAPFLIDGMTGTEIKSFAATREIEMGSSIYDFVTPHLDVFEERWRNQDFPIAEDFAKNHACLPLHNEMTQDDAWIVNEMFRALA